MYEQYLMIMNYVCCEVVVTMSGLVREGLSTFEHVGARRVGEMEQGKEATPEHSQHEQAKKVDQDACIV